MSTTQYRQYVNQKVRVNESPINVELNLSKAFPIPSLIPNAEFHICISDNAIRQNHPL
jgi:hypothetical protein